MALAPFPKHPGDGLESSNAEKPNENNAKLTAIKYAIQSAMLDSGSSSTFIQHANGFECTSPSNIVVSTANGGTLTSTGQVSLLLSKLSRGAQTSHVLPD